MYYAKPLTRAPTLEVFADQQTGRVLEMDNVDMHCPGIKRFPREFYMLVYQRIEDNDDDKSPSYGRHNTSKGRTSPAHIVVICFIMVVVIIIIFVFVFEKFTVRYCYGQYPWWRAEKKMRPAKPKSKNFGTFVCRPSMLNNS